MNTDPQEIRSQVDAALGDLPDLNPESAGDADIETIEAIDALGRRLEQAHQILVDALESVEKG